LETSRARAQESVDVLHFLQTQDTLACAEMIRKASLALREDASGIWHAWVCRRNGQLAGVATTAPPSGRYNREADYDARLWAVDRDAAAALIQALPDTGKRLLRTTCPITQGYLASCPHVLRAGEGSLLLTVSPDTFRPVAVRAVVDLSSYEKEQFENVFTGCEAASNWDAFRVWVDHMKARWFAILREDRTVVHAVLTPVVEASRTSPGVSSIKGLYTQSTHRRQGLGAALVSHLTEIILQAGDYPLYLVSPSNRAARLLAAKLGYSLHCTEEHFEVG
jgi:GNAT superfamily N-acetyltransferase